MTSTRMRVAEVFFGMEGHPGVEALAVEVQRRHPGIGQATVYRTMKLLCDSGLVVPLEFGEGFARYEALAPEEHHDHLVCEMCGGVVEFIVEEIEALQNAVTERHGFMPTHHRLEIYGLCRKCR
jgi:Fur family ferric uptake transcriptional regulator